MTAFRIDLSELRVKAFVGRPLGEAARKKFKLDEIDHREGDVDVVIPTNTMALNSSFFLGMFDKSIQHSGGKEQFLTKYKFGVGYERFQSSIDQCIERSLLLVKE